VRVCVCVCGVCACVCMCVWCVCACVCEGVCVCGVCVCACVCGVCLMIVTTNSDYCPRSITIWYFEMEKKTVDCEVGADIVNCLIVWCCGV